MTTTNTDTLTPARELRIFKAHDLGGSRSLYLPTEDILILCTPHAAADDPDLLPPPAPGALEPLSTTDRTIARGLADMPEYLLGGGEVEPGATDDDMPADLRPLALAKLARIARVECVDGDTVVTKCVDDSWTARVGNDANGTAIMYAASVAIEGQILRTQVHARALGCDTYEAWFNVGRQAGRKLAGYSATISACWPDALAAARALTATNAGNLPHARYANGIVAFGILEGIAGHPLGVLAFAAGSAELPYDDGLIVRGLYS